ncbi:MAG: hypothetical protein ACHQXG_00945 [Nitrososphaerales archaeon]
MDNVLKSLSIGIIAFATIIMIGSVSTQNQVFAPRTCTGCIAQFQILTRSFGADAGKIILSEHAFPITQFIQLNLQFDKSIIKAFYAGHAIQGDPVIPDLVKQYGEDLLNLHPPDSVKPLLLAYQQGVLRIFFPDP